MGCNFIPSTAINQLEMWQKETWDSKTIDRELGFNDMRVFLHDLAYQQDTEGFLKRMDAYLDLAVQTMTRQLAGRRIARRIPLSSEDDYALWCVPAAEKGTPCLVVWTTGEAHRLRVPLPEEVPAAGLSAMNGYGQPQAFSLEGHKLRLKAEPLPAYFRWPAERHSKKR